MILDCCHSAGVDRDVIPLTRHSPRHFQNPPSISSDYDHDIISTTYRRYTEAPGFRGQDLDSHVSLAACSSWQTAAEDTVVNPPRGYFTRALTEVLRASLISELTYKSVIQQVADRMKTMIARRQG